MLEHQSVQFICKFELRYGLERTVQNVVNQRTPAKKISMERGMAGRIGFATFGSLAGAPTRRVAGASVLNKPLDVGVDGSP